MRGLPGQIVVSHDVHALLGGDATLAPAACGAFELVALSSAESERLPAITTVGAPELDAPELDARVRPFVPRVLVDRMAAGQSDWTAEFRKLTAVYVNLRAFEPGVPDVAVRVQSAVRAIAEVVNPAGVPITNIVANEKDLVQIACGLPPYAQEHSATLAVERRCISTAPCPGSGSRLRSASRRDAFCAEVGWARRRE